MAFPASGTARGRLVLASGDPNLAFKRYVESPATLVIEQDYVTAVQDADAARFRDDPRRIG